jgi:hypothetical protein
MTSASGASTASPTKGTARLTTKRSLESVLEARVVFWALGEGMLTFKFTPQGQRGWPDRLFIHNGLCAFVEMKAVQDKPRKLQEFNISILNEHGTPAIWTDNYEEAIKFLTSTLIHTRLKL